VNADRGTAEFDTPMHACKRHAPIVTGGMMSPTITAWPMVDFYDWCGEHPDFPAYLEGRKKGQVGRLGIGVRYRRPRNARQGKPMTAKDPDPQTQKAPDA
jgi:hypothetical protein